MKYFLMLIMFLLVSNIYFAQEFKYKDERNLAEAIFNSLQEADLEKFSSYCISEERFSKMLSSMGDKSEKEKSIKSELRGIKPIEMLNEAKEGFNKALDQLKLDSVNLIECNFPELADYKTRFEITNLRCMKIKFYICPENKYLIKIDLFKTTDDIFVYDFKLTKGGMI